MFFCLVFVMPLRVSVYLMSWLSFVVSSCDFVTFLLVSFVRRGT